MLCLVIGMKMFLGGFIVALLLSIQANWAAGLPVRGLAAFPQRLREADPPAAASPGLAEAVPSDLALTPWPEATIDAVLVVAA
jgi:hypothetical protein